MRSNTIVVVAALLLSWALLAWLPGSDSERPVRSKPFIHVADTVSTESRQYLETLPDPATLPEWPASDDLPGWKRAWRAGQADSEPKVRATLKRYAPTIQERKLGDVPVLEIKPKDWKDNGKVLVHLHGGAYTMYSAHSRLPSSVPAAAATGLRVISVDYTVAPTGKWQTVTDEVLAVLDGLGKEGFKPKDIAIYGESAGGGLSAGSVLKMRDRGLGMPAAVVLWSPWADITDSGDSAITMKHFEPYFLYQRHLKHSADAYANPKNQKHPYVSPVYGDYTKGFPPTLIQGGTRELFLSHFVRLYRAIDGAGRLAVLDLHDGMPHVFQMRPELADAPETVAALKKMAAFLKRHLSPAPGH